MALFTSSAAGLLRPEEISALVIEPLKDASTALAVSTNVSTQSTAFRIPSVVADPAGGWYQEGANIDLSDAEIAETIVVPTKLAVLSKISNELAADSSPAAASVVGQGMARDIARKVDSAFFGNTVANGPSGLLSLEDAQTVAGGDLDNLDPFAECMSKLEAVGSEATSFVCSATDGLHLSQLKTFDGVTQSNQPLLESDPAKPTKRRIFGVPLHVVPDGIIEPGVIWALDRAKLFTVIRQDVTLEVDSSVFFASDSLAVRAILRIGFGHPHEPAIVKMTWGSSS